MRHGVEWVTKKSRRRCVRIFETREEALAFEKVVEPGAAWASAFVEVTEDELGPEAYKLRVAEGIENRQHMRLKDGNVVVRLSWGSDRVFWE